MREVARRAGVSLGALQHYFATKAELTGAVMEFALAGIESADLRAPFEESTTFRDAMAIGMKRRLAWARANPDTVRLGARMAVEQPEHEWPQEREVQARILERIESAQASGELSTFEPLFLLTLMEIVANGWTQYRAHYMRHLASSYASDDDLDAAFAEFVVGLFLDGASA